MFYVDASVLIAALTVERETASAIQWLVRSQDAGIAASPWLATEVASALARKARTHELTDARRAEAWEEFRRLTSRSFRMLPVEGSHFNAAADLILRRSSSLRAGDALHLSVAAANGLLLVTFDRHFAATATRLGHNVELLA